MTDTTDSSGRALLDSTTSFRESLFPLTDMPRDLHSEPVPPVPAKQRSPKTAKPAKTTSRTRTNGKNGNDSAAARRPRQSRDYDAAKTLTFGAGERVPSRLGAVEWARDAVNWPRATTAVAVAMALALRLDETLVCWPGQERIAEDVCSTSRSVRTALRELEDRGVVATLYLWRGKEPSGCVYVLNVDKWLDDVLDNPAALLRRVVDVREQGFAMGLNIRELPKDTELSTTAPTNPRVKK